MPPWQCHQYHQKLDVDEKRYVAVNKLQSEIWKHGDQTKHECWAVYLKILNYSYLRQHKVLDTRSELTTITHGQSRVRLPIVLDSVSRSWMWQCISWTNAAVIQALTAHEYGHLICFPARSVNMANLTSPLLALHGPDDPYYVVSATATTAAFPRNPIYGTIPCITINLLPPHPPPRVGNKHSCT